MGLGWSNAEEFKAVESRGAETEGGFDFRDLGFGCREVVFMEVQSLRSRLSVSCIKRVAAAFPHLSLQRAKIAVLCHTQPHTLNQKPQNFETDPEA